MSDYLIKLVRDGIPMALGQPGTLHYRPLDDADEHSRQLRKKLGEEVMEYIIEPTLGELADVMEVVEALAALDHCATLADVSAEAERKRVARGGFDGGTGMFARHPLDGRGGS